MQRLSLPLLLALFFARTALSQSPEHLSGGGAVSPTISYQALITAPDGTGIDDAVCPVHIELIPVEGGIPATPVWSDDFTAPIVSGVLNLQLGSHNPLPDARQLDQPLTLSVSVRGGPPIVSQLSAVPYALNVPDSSITAAKLGTDYVSAVTIDGQRVTTKGGPLNLQAGEGLQLTYNEEANSVRIGVPRALIHNGGGAVDYWGEAGNALVTGAEWLGTSNNFPLIIKSNSRQSIEIRPATLGADDAPGIIGGYFGNGFGSGVEGGTIAGGGRLTQVNNVWNNYGFIGGGAGNTAGESILNSTDDTFIVVVGGLSNWAREEFAAIVGGKSNQALSWYSFIGGGDSNYIEHQDSWAADKSTIGGGNHNRIYDEFATIGGGDTNVVFKNAPYGTIGGGQGNVIANPSVEEDNNLLTNSTIGGGYLNSIQSGFATIAGGDTNRILELGDHSFIGGGRTNEVGGRSSGIASGDSNFIEAGSGNRVTAFSFIGGGSRNTIARDDNDDNWWTLNAAICGGYRNLVTEFATFIGGGDSNTVIEEFSSIVGGHHNFVSDSCSNIGGGAWNRARAADANIGGGDNNTTFGHSSAIAGGDTNNILLTGKAAFIGAGQRNIVSGAAAAIGAGRDNIVATNWSSIVGGDSNHIELTSNTGGFEADHSFIGGGRFNLVKSRLSGIASGDSNIIEQISSDPGFEADHSFIGGGYLNRIQSQYCAIGGGRNNIIATDKFSSLLGFIGGGDSNSIEIGCHFDVVGGGNRNSNGAGISFMGGGEHNRIHDNSLWNTLVAGKFNWIGYGKTPLSKGVINSTLVGGDSNSVFANNASMIGGHLNVIDTEAHFSTLGGGINNYIHPHAVRSTISGGSFNHILDAGQFAAIPGGDSLIAQSYAQTVMGFNNLAGGNAMQGLNPAGVDDPLVIVGNGRNPTSRANAFEVSYDGHTVVYDQILSGGLRIPTFGATYADNIVYAWGDIPLAPPGPVTPNSDFGVVGVAHPLPGVYVITIQNQNPDVGGVRTLADASITVTTQDNTPPEQQATNCSHATASQIGVGGPNSFVIRTFWGCDPQDQPFFFKVTGR